MEKYDFEVVDEHGRVAVERSVEVPDSTAMWRRIAVMARNLHARGRLIRVTNGKGIIVLVGTATALQLCADLLNSLPPL